MFNNRLISKNVLFGFAARVATLTLAITVPRLLIKTFGSEVNGLLATITQIFMYLALLEAGIGNSAINALYKPLGENNTYEANKVVCEARGYYRRVSIIYGICILGFAVIYPQFAKATMSKGLIFWIIILQGTPSFLSQYYCAAYDQLLTAAGKKYIAESIYLGANALSSIVKIFLVSFGFNVITIQIGHAIISVLRIPIVVKYVKSKYPWLSTDTIIMRKHLKERGAFVVHEISTTIFCNTDIFIISTFESFAMASVYNVYNLVYSAISTMLFTASAGLGFIFGQSQYQDTKDFARIYDLYSIVYSCASFILFTVTYIMITPFVKLYTSGIDDIDYLMKGLPLLFTLINLMSGVRASASKLINITGHASKTQIGSIAEAIINLVSSLILVNYCGVYGVLAGTIIALLFRMNDIIIYANVRILNRSPLWEYRNLALNLLMFLFIFYVTNLVDLNITSYYSFAVHGVVITLIVIIAYSVIAIFANLKLLKYFIGRLHRVSS